MYNLPLPSGVRKHVAAASLNRMSRPPGAQLNRPVEADDCAITKLLHDWLRDPVPHVSGSLVVIKKSPPHGGPAGDAFRSRRREADYAGMEVREQRVDLSRIEIADQLIFNAENSFCRG
jgi:hypothetical protein